MPLYILGYMLVTTGEELSWRGFWHTLLRLTVRVGGVLVQGTYRYTRMWAREAGRMWRVVGGHVSALPDAASQG